MKNIKKLLSIVMVLAMVLALGVQAFAAAEPTTPPQDSLVTLPDDYIGHKMVAYKIFEGRQNSANKDGIPGDYGVDSAELGITGWASGVNVEELLTDLNTTYPSAGFKSGMTAVEAAQAISNMKLQSNTAEALAFARLVAKHIKADGTVTFDAKTAEENARLTQTLSSGYWIIVDETEFSAENPEPDGWSYSSYLLQVVGNENLTLSKKVDNPTLEKKVNGVDSVVAVGPNGEYLGDILTFTLTATLPGNYADYETYFMEFVDTMSKGLTPYTDDTHYPTILYGKAGVATKTTLTWTPDAETAGEHSFSYEITNLKEEATLSAYDTVTLTYYAKINNAAEVRNPNKASLNYSNNPNSTDHGKTPDDTVIVFTLFLDVNKVDSEQAPLDGAAFELSIWDGSAWKSLKNAPVVEVEDAEGNVSYTVDFDELGAGFYKLEETVVPAGFNKAPDMYFEVKATSTNTGKPDGSDFKIETLEVVMTDANREPNGADSKITVESASSGELSGTLDTTVVNDNGLELPETGGIGTTIFYVVGAILVAGAVILLVTRKRANDATK